MVCKLQTNENIHSLDIGSRILKQKRSRVYNTFHLCPFNTFQIIKKSNTYFYKISRIIETYYCNLAPNGIYPL